MCKLNFEQNNRGILDNLKQISINDFNILNYYYNLRRPETSDSNILALYLWRQCYPTWYYTKDNAVIWIAKEENGQYYSVIPCCKKEDLKNAFEETRRFFNNELGKKLCMYVVDKEAIELLELSADEYIIQREEAYDDYIYDGEKLRTLSGRKYHKKKNHLNAFKREYDGRYRFEFLNKDNKDELMEFLSRWFKNKGDTEHGEYIEYEMLGIEEILEYQEIIGFEIGGVYIDDVLQAFAIGKYYEEEDMVYVSVEKANNEYRGLYTYVNSEFLSQAFPNSGKVNREDDMGIEGLKKAKESYNPIYKVEKYTILQK